MGMAALKRPAGAEVNGPGKPLSYLDVPLRGGDVVWCAFPFADTPGQPGPKARPCLVLEQRAINGKAFFLVAYGTTQHLNQWDRWPGDIVLGPSDGEHFSETGLDGPGKFRLCQVALLPAIPAYFPRPPFAVTYVAKRPVDGCRIGRFTPLMLEVVAHSWKELRAYQAKQADLGFVPGDPLGPLANPNLLATGKNGLRPKFR